MPYEQFPNPGDNHPEVIQDPDAVRPAEQLTLVSLLIAINEQTHLHTGANGYNPQVFKKGDRPDRPNAIAQLTRIKKLAPGLVATTNWFISSIPDGFHIDKHTHVLPSRTASLRSTPQDRMKLAKEMLDGFAASQESSATQDTLGMSFVSEKEARSLLDLFTGTEDA